MSRIADSRPEIGPTWDVRRAAHPAHAALGAVARVPDRPGADSRTHAGDHQPQTSRGRAVRRLVLPAATRIMRVSADWADPAADPGFKVLGTVVMKIRFRKFVRRNSRTLLMVVMAFLLVAFLIPSTFQAKTDRFGNLNQPVGEIYGRKVTSADLQAFAHELELAGALLPGRVPSRLPENLLTSFYLLSTEARHMGIRVGQDEVKAELVGTGATEDRLRQLQEGYGRSYAEFFDAVGRWMALEQYMGVEASAVKESLPRLELAYRDASQEAVAELAVVSARAFVHAVPEPAEDELKEFFKECSDRETAHTPTELKFGYKLPDRVQLEILTVDPDQVAAARKIRITPAQVRKYFEENWEQYRKTSPGSPPPAETRSPKEVPMTESEDRLVRQELLTLKSREIAQGLVNQMYEEEARRPWASSARDKDGFTERPAEGVVSFADLAQKYSTDYKVEYTKTDLVDQRGLMTDRKGVGFAVYMMGRQPVYGVQLAMRVKGIEKEDPKDGLPVLNVDEPAPVLVRQEWDPATRRQVPGQAYLFRVIQVAPAAPPASIDEVKPQIVEDWKLMKAFEQARTGADVLVARAREDGLDAAVQESAELKSVLEVADAAASQPTTAPAKPTQYLEQLGPTRIALKRSTPSDLKLGRLSGVAEAVFGLADPAVTQSAPAHRVTITPQADQFRWVVAELIEVKPIYRGPFEQQLASGQLARQPGGASNESETFRNAWLAPQNVEARTGFKPAPPPQPGAAVPP